MRNDIREHNAASQLSRIFGGNSLPWHHRAERGGGRLELRNIDPGGETVRSGGSREGHHLRVYLQDRYGVPRQAWTRFDVLLDQQLCRSPTEHCPRGNEIDDGPNHLANRKPLRRDMLTRRSKATVIIDRDE